jgi:hypothetical protein
MDACPTGGCSSRDTWHLRTKSLDPRASGNVEVSGRAYTVAVVGRVV